MSPKHTSVALSLLLACCLLLAPGTGPSSAADAAKKNLSPEHRKWLEVVALLLTTAERQEFLTLKEDHQREAFIRRFWESRDPYPETARNEFKDLWEARLEEARVRYGNITEDRARMYLLHGEPANVVTTDCGAVLWPLEIWYYARSERLPGEIYLIFVQVSGGGPYRLWWPSEGYRTLLATYRPQREEDLVTFLKTVEKRCTLADGALITEAVLRLQQDEDMGLSSLVDTRPPVRDPEWLATFRTFSTEVPEEAEPLPATLSVRFPDRHQSRTVVEITVRIPLAEATLSDGITHRSYNFQLTGELLREKELFESFRYRFDLPAEGVTETSMPLIVERHLRPGTFTLVLKVEDLNSRRVFRTEEELVVPVLEEGASVADGAVAATGMGTEAQIRILPPQGEVLTGPVRIDTATSGEGIARVTFFLDDRPILTKNRPPYSVELNLGSFPQSRTLEVVAYDADGRDLARDRLVLNRGGQRFAVRLTEPRPSATRSGAVIVQASVDVPDGKSLERVEFYLNERRLATLYQPPFIQTLIPPPDEPTLFLRVMAYLADGHSAEDVIFLKAQDFSEEIQVQLVELYATVVDRSGRPVLNLTREDFRVFEEGVEQEILRFERTSDLPLQLALLFDTSTSMERHFEAARKAALEFVEQTVRPMDRAAVITFSDSPTVAVKLTDDHSALLAAIAGLCPERSTALYDSLVFALKYLQGAQGQRAVLLLSDGQDRQSKMPFDKTLEFARGAGISIYVVGVGIAKLDLLARNRLSRLASETGGRAFFLDSVDKLGEIYASIQEELRSRYLLTYQSSATGTAFRPVEVRISRSETQVRSIQGYFPTR